MLTSLTTCASLASTGFTLPSNTVSTTSTMFTTPNRSTSALPTIMYKFKSEKHFNTLVAEPDDTWEDVRYRLELKYGMQENLSKRDKIVQLAYIEGMFQDTMLPIKDDHKFCTPSNKEHRIILSRRPLPVDMKPYIPPKYRQVQGIQYDPYCPALDRVDTMNIVNTAQWQTMNEEEKIANFMQQSVTDFNKELQKTRTNKFDRHITSLRTMTAEELKPWATYECHCCGQVGDHYRRNCPKLLNKAFVPLDRRRLPHGIPRNQIRDALTEEERNRAYKTADGRLVVMIDKQYNCRICPSNQSKIQKTSKTRETIGASRDRRHNKI